MNPAAIPPPAIRYPPPHEAQIVLDPAAAVELADLIARGGGEMAADPAADTHVHVEYFDGHHYPAESEIGLVLRIVR